MENLRRHFPFTASSSYKVSNLKSTSPLPSPAQSRSQFHTSLPNSLHSDVQDLLLRVGNFVNELNALCGAGTHLAQKLSDMLKHTPYCDTAGQLKQAVSNLCQVVNASGRRFREDAEGSLKSLQTKLKSQNREDHYSPANLQVFGRCLASFIQLQCQLYMSAYEAMHLFSKCQDHRDLVSFRSQTPQTRPSSVSSNLINPSCMPATTNQSVEFLHRVSSSSSFTADQDTSHNRRRNQMVGEAVVSYASQSGAEQLYCTDKRDGSLSHFYTQFNADVRHDERNRLVDESQVDSGRIPQEQSGEVTLRLTETRDNSGKTKSQEDPSSNDIQDVIDFLSRSSLQPPSSQMQNIPESRVSYNVAEFPVWHRTLATSYSNRSAEMRRMELGAKPSDPTRQTWPRAPPRPDDPFGSGGEVSEQDMDDFRNYCATVQNLTCSPGYPSQFRQSLFSFPYSSAIGLQAQKIWSPQQPNLPQQWNEPGRERESGGSSSDETSSYNGHDNNVFKCVQNLAGPEADVTGQQRRRHSSSDGGLAENLADSSSRRKSVDDLRLEVTKYTNTWPPKQVWSKNSSPVHMMSNWSDADSSAMFFLPSSFGQIT